MFYTFREPNFFTFRVIFSQIASIFTFSVDIVLHLAAFSHIEAFSHLRVPQSVRGGGGGHRGKWSHVYGY